MHPAPSIVLFTTASGAGYGLLVLAAAFALFGIVPVTTTSGLALLAPAVLLVTAGLLSSTLHLGHPERAWRAFSQWRSSWLSREAVAAVTAYAPALVLAWFWLLEQRLVALAAVLTVIACLVTIYCTAMIYASLKPIPRWHHPLVPALYLAFGLASGAVIAAAASAWIGLASSAPAIAALLLTALAWALKWHYWQSVDRAAAIATTADAIGLAERGTARLFEPPHTGPNYITDEMGFRIARKHKTKLRRYALAAGAALPCAALVLALALPAGAAAILLTVAAAASLLGVLIERWLFFAEARHVVMLYYGEAAV